MALVESPYLLEASGIGPIFVVAAGEKQVEIPIASPPSAALSLGPLPRRKHGVKVSARRRNLPEHAIPGKANTVAVRTPCDVRNRAFAFRQFLAVCPVNFHRIETIALVRICYGRCFRRPGRREDSHPLHDEARRAPGRSHGENAVSRREKKTCSI